VRTIIDLEKNTIRTLKFHAVIENSTVKSLMESAIQMYVNQKEVEILNNLSDEEKEDIGLLMLMQESDVKDFVSREKIFRTLKT
jgi:hypothetical protein